MAGFDFEQKNTEESGTGPAQGSGYTSFTDWWGKLGPDKKNALQMGALTAGLSLMATPSSNRPISMTESLGRAGLHGLDSYTTSLAASKKGAREDAEMGLRTREAAAREKGVGLDEERLNLDRQKHTDEEKRWSPGKPAVYEEVDTGFIPLEVKGASIEEGALDKGLDGYGLKPPKPYNLEMSNYKPGLRDKPVLDVSGGGKTPSSYRFGNTEKGLRMVSPAEAPGINYQEKIAGIQKSSSEAGKVWDIQGEYLLNKATGESIKLNTAKTFKHSVDLGDKVEVHYTDGTIETKKKGLDPQKPLERIREEKKAETEGKALGEGGDATYTKIEGEAFKAFMTNGYKSLTTQQRAIVDKKLTDPLMTQATKLVMDDVKMFNKPAEEKTKKVFALYEQMKAQQGEVSYHNTGPDRLISEDYVSEPNTGLRPKTEGTKGKKAGRRDINVFN